MCVCVRERERKREKSGESARDWERYRMSVCEKKRMSEIKRVRECVCVCVCVRVRE